MFQTSQPKEVSNNHLWHMVTSEEGEELSHFRFWRFNLLSLGQALLLGFVWWFALGAISPEVRIVNFRFDWIWLIMAFISYFLIGGPGEATFHIELLHSRRSWIPFSKQMYVGHDHNHHGATRVSLVGNKLNADNYEISRWEQFLSSTFPFMSIFLIALLASVASALVLQPFFPKVALVTPVAAAALLAAVLYENFHAAHHMSHDMWRKWCWLPNPLGWMAKRARMHHMLHHVYKFCNLNVVGVGGWKVGDHLRDTYKYHEGLLQAWLNNDPNIDSEEIMAYLKERPRPLSVRISEALFGKKKSKSKQE
ncbi:MAG: hypothetical protein Q8Q05_03400 [bacterium]|nr:hypothetical protein [bacterium]